MVVDTLFVNMVILPVVINIFAGLLVAILRKPWRWVALILAATALFILVFTAYGQVPKLVVVPDVRGYWGHRAYVLCEEVGLNPEIVGGPYGLYGGEVLKQSLPPGSEVFRGEKIILTVCRGAPVSGPFLEREFRSGTEKEVKK